MACVWNEGDCVRGNLVLVDSGQVRDWGCGTDGRTSGRVCGGVQCSRKSVDVWVGAVVKAGEGGFGKGGGSRCSAGAWDVGMRQCFRSRVWTSVEVTQPLTGTVAGVGVRGSLVTCGVWRG